MDSLLVISDEPALAEILASELPGLHVAQASSKEAQAHLQGKDFVLILADTDDAGASAYLSTVTMPVVKVVRPLRLAGLLRDIRMHLQGKAARKEIEVSAGLHLLPGERLLLSKDGGVRVELTEKEAELLRRLVTHQTPVARETLLKEVWGYSNEASTHTLETHIYRLRSKLREAGAGLDIVSLEEGGYALGRG